MGFVRYSKMSLRNDVKGDGALFFFVIHVDAEVRKPSFLY